MGLMKEDAYFEKRYGADIVSARISGWSVQSTRVRITECRRFDLCSAVDRWKVKSSFKLRARTLTFGLTNAV